MHITIVALVRAKDKKDALVEAKRVFDALTKDGLYYDYYSIYDEDSYRYDTEEGQSLLQSVFGQQTIYFNDRLAAVRKALAAAKPDEEMMEDQQFRWECGQVGEWRGSAVRVYDSDVEGVTDKAHLQNIVEDWPRLVKTGDHEKSPHPLWVVSADGHY